MIEFKKIIQNKSIFHIPIYSMFQRNTHKINLTSDGNVNRYLTTYYLNNNFKKLSILVPMEENSINYDQYKKYIDYIKNIELINSKNIINSALYQRETEFAENVFDEVKNQYDIIIFEGQKIGLKLIENKKENTKLIYWCPVCATNNKTRSFLNKDKEINEFIFLNEKIDYIIVASIDQVNYLKELGIDEQKICLITQHIDRTLPMFNNYDRDDTIISFIKYLENENKKVIYLPFRLSDEGYKLNEILTVIKKYSNCILIYPNLNNVSIDELMKNLKDESFRNLLENGYKISSSRNTFYTILDNCENAIIPYFEDLNFINHSTIQELFNENKKPICKIACNSKNLERILNEE